MKTSGWELIGPIVRTQIRRGTEDLAELVGAVPAQPCVPFITYMLGPAAKPDRISDSSTQCRIGSPVQLWSVTCLARWVRTL